MSIQQHKTQCKACKSNRSNYDVNCFNLSSQNVNRVNRVTQNTTWNMLIQRHKTQSEVCVSICVSTYENFRQNIQELKGIKKEIWNSLKIFVVFVMMKPCVLVCVLCCWFTFCFLYLLLCSFGGGWQKPLLHWTPCTKVADLSNATFLGTRL